MSRMAASSGTTVSHSRSVRSVMPCSAARRLGPKITRWTIHSMYTAPRMTPVAARTESTCPRGRLPQLPSGVVEVKVPMRMRNSPMKPLVPGKPIDESTTTRNTAERAGATRATPPYCDRSRVCVRS